MISITTFRTDSTRIRTTREKNRSIPYCCWCRSGTQLLAR